jgi:hypothetical protein
MRFLRLLLTRAIKSPSRLLSLPLVIVFVLPLCAWGANAAAVWDRPAAALADQIAGILGPGQAHLTMRNLSSIAADDLPVIRRVLEQDLRTHGITLSGDDAANRLRITLSENTHARLWVAEVIEGRETKTVMVSVDLPRQSPVPVSAGITLHKQSILSAREPILAALEVADGLVVLEPERIAVYMHSPNGWDQKTIVPISQKRALSRDPRGILVATGAGQTFDAYVAGAMCSGESSSGQWSIRCHETDDPWPIVAPTLMQVGSAPAPPLKAFYNATRDYFTGVVAPGLGVDLPSFYTAAWFPRAHVPALLLNGVDGKLEIVENAALKPIAGARDWGSDFAALLSGCGSGVQIVASGSGPAALDSLRAYEIPSLEAIAASPPLNMDGSVTALWAPASGTSLVAVVRTLPASAQQIQYEVDRVTATCN